MALLVVMNQGSSSEELQAVSRIGSTVGLRGTVFEGDPPMVLLDGEPLLDIEDDIASLPGVVRIANSRDTASPVTSNLRIAGIRPLVPPAILMEQLPLPREGAIVVQRSRQAISQVLSGADDRLIVVVGPCSIHDADAARDYATRLASLSQEVGEDLILIMRVYFEKPRTTVGWKGLINDPYRDGSFAVNDGLRIARQVLLDVIELGLPAGCEFLDPVSPQFIADAVSWAAIGARTTESQVHRNLSSGLSMPVGFKNGTSGDVQIAIDALSAASYPHQFMSVTEQGVAAIVETRGNRDTHLILRGGQRGTNYDEASVRETLEALQLSNLPARVMIDASHGNSDKDYARQPLVSRSVAEQVASGNKGIVGVMLESFLKDGRQDLNGKPNLEYGQSVTDACMGWDMTIPVIRELADAVRQRRLISTIEGS
ncbi:3-deoxy-7-phosphoheptulonate synthase [soil metagenome]